MPTLADLSRETHVPLPFLIKALMEFGRLKTMTSELTVEEIDFLKQYLEANPPPDERGWRPGGFRPRRPRPGSDPPDAGVREPQRPRPTPPSAAAEEPASDGD